MGAIDRRVRQLPVRVTGESPNRGDWPKTAFAPRKSALSLYGLKDMPEGAALLPQLGRYTEGAGCVYIRKLDDVDLDVLRQLIAIAWARGDDDEPAG